MFIKKKDRKIAVNEDKQKYRDNENINEQREGGDGSLNKMNKEDNEQVDEQED